jgi:hypothetical protein
MQPAVNIPQDPDWLNDANCKDLDINDFFVEAGHVIEDATLNTCRSCPVRRECIIHAYSRDSRGGYFGGLSPGQRRDMDLDEALEYAKTDLVNKPRVIIGTTETDPDEDFNYH